MFVENFDRPYINPNTGTLHPPLSFHVAVYFIVVTITTVGFGDVVPVTIAGQIIIVCMLAIGYVCFFEV